MAMPSSLSRSKFTTLPARRWDSTVFGFLLSTNLIQSPSATRRRRKIVVLVFILQSLGAPPPPDEEAENGRHEGQENQDDPAQTAQGFFIETECQRLWNFWRDANHLFTTEEPVDAGGNKIEPLLVLGERVVLNEGGIGYYDDACGIDLDPLIGAAALFDRGGDR